MDEEPNPTKDILYEVINHLEEKQIHQEIAGGNHEKIINQIIDLSKEKILQLDGVYENNLAKFLTAFLHYLLTIVLIPSQRKIQKNNIDIDIIVPNLKTLETNPKNAILICIPEIHESPIENQIKEMNSLQSNKENIWYVTEKNITEKSYSINDQTFWRILNDINKFLDSTKTRQFRFFKV